MKPIEAWRAELGTPEWVWRGLLVSHPAGKQLTEAEYRDACKAVETRPLNAAQAAEEEHG